MQTVTVSPKYQIVIPASLRHSMGVHPGQKLNVMGDGELITLVPDSDVRNMRGLLKGINTAFTREDDGERA